MGLPTTREYTAGPGDKFLSGAYNILQDCIVGRKKPPWSRIFFPKFIFASNFAGGANPAGSTLARCYNSAAGVSGAEFDIPFEPGDRITNFKYWAFGNATASVTGGEVRYYPSMSGAFTGLAAWADAVRAAAWSLVDVNVIGIAPFVPTILAAGHILTARFTTDVAGYSIGGCEAFFDRL